MHLNCIADNDYRGMTGNSYCLHLSSHYEIFIDLLNVGSGKVAFLGSLWMSNCSTDKISQST